MHFRTHRPPTGNLIRKFLFLFGLRFFCADKRLHKRAVYAILIPGNGRHKAAAAAGSGCLPGKRRQSCEEA